MICNLPRAQVERFIQYTFVKIYDEKLVNFMELADSIYKETSAGSAENALSYLQMLPSVFMSLYTERKEVRALVDASQLSVAGPLIDRWQDLGNVRRDLNLDAPVLTTEQKLFVDTGRDLTLKLSNTVYSKGWNITEGLAANEALTDKNFQHNIKVHVKRYAKTLNAVRDMNGKPVGGLQFGNQFDDLSVALFVGDNPNENRVGYMRNLQYYLNGEPITLDEMAAIVHVDPARLEEMKAAKPLYQMLYQRLVEKLGTAPSVTLSLDELGIELVPNYNKFDIIEQSSMGPQTTARATAPVELGIASEYYHNEGKGLIVKSSDGQYVSEVEDADAPPLPEYKDAEGNVIPYRGYYALATMPNGRKYWVGVRPTSLDKLLPQDRGEFVNRIHRAMVELSNLKDQNPNNKVAAQIIAANLNADYYFFIDKQVADYNIFFVSTYSGTSKSYVLRANFVKRNAAPVGNFPAYFFDDIDEIKSIEDVVKQINAAASVAGLRGVQITTDTIRKNVPYDRINHVHFRQSQETLGKMFTTTVGPTIFQNAFFSFNIKAEPTETPKYEEAARAPQPGDINVAGMTVSREEIEKIMREAKEMQKREERKGGVDPFKLASGEKLESITAEEFKELNKILPKFISVENMETVVKNLNAKGVPLGMFRKTIIYLAQTVERGTAYHEAFHAIFRTVLTDEEIDALLAEGKAELLKKSPNALSKQALKEFAEERGYEDFTNEELEALIIEEHLADKFQEVKLKDKEKSLLAKLLEKITNFVRWMLNKETDIDVFFRKASKGAFANATMKKNRFNNLGYGVYDLIPGLHTVHESEAVVKTIAAIFAEHGREYDYDIDLIIRERVKFYDPLSTENLAGIGRGVIDAKKLAARHALYSSPAARAVITSEVEKLLFKVYKYDVDLDDFIEEESEYGRASENLFDRSLDQSGGFNSVSKELKRFILTTTYDAIDPITGRTIRTVIDGEHVYASLERSLAGKSPADIIEGLKALSRINPQIKAVWEKLKRETGLVESTPDTAGNEDVFLDLSPENYKDNLDGKQLMIRLLKALEKNFMNHLQVVATFDDGNTTTRVFSSNRQDAGRIQMNQWQQTFAGRVYDELKENKTLKNSILNTLSRFPKKYNSATATKQDLEDLRKAFWDLGLEFTPGYILFSFGYKTDPDAAALQNAFGSVPKLDLPFIAQLYEYIDKGRNIYEAGDITTGLDEEGKTVDLGLTSIIKKHADANVTFDPNIFQSNFQTADNKTRYSYVLPNYYINKVSEIRETLGSEQAIQSMMQHDYFKYNHLINLFTDANTNSQLVAANFRHLAAEITGDIREEVVQEAGRARLKEGLVFKDTDPKSLLLTNLALFNDRREEAVNLIQYVGEKQQRSVTRTTQHYAKFWPLQLEAKSTMLSVELPVIDGLVHSGRFTTSGRRYFVNYIKQELARISILTKPYNERNIAYKIDNKRNEFVYFKFLNNPVVDKMLGITRDSKGNVTAIKRLESAEERGKVFDTLAGMVEKELYKEFQVFEQRLKDYGIIGRENLLDQPAINKYYKGATEQESQDNYLQSYFYNHLLNTIGVKQLLFGDESQFKDDVDLVKRAAGLLAFGVSRGERQYTTAYTTEAVEYIEASSMFDGNPDTTKVTKREDESDVHFKQRLADGLKDGSIIEINTDDAGSEMTAQEFINIQYDLGRLTREKLEALELLRDGIKPFSKEEERYNELLRLIKKADGSTDNSPAIDAVSMKLVSFGGGFIDGRYTDTHNIYYDKMSVAVMFKNFTSRWDEVRQKWVPQKGLEALHNKRVWMEKNGIGQVNPKSAGKLKTGPLVDHKAFRREGLDEDQELPTDLAYQAQLRAGKNQRLQVEVASHGMDKVTALSQAAQLIDTETSDAMLPYRKEYQEALTQLRQESFKEALRLVSEDAKGEFAGSRDIKIFLEKVRDIITSTTPSQSMLEFLQTEGVDTKYDFNVPAVLAKLENVFLAHFNREALVQKFPGRTFVLRSSRDYNVIYDKATGLIVQRDEYLRSEDPSKYEGDDYGTRELRVHKGVDGKIQKAEVVISRGTAALYGLKIGDEIPTELLEAFGVRIPTQSHHSFVPFVVVDFLPEYLGDTIILPKEIVFLSGADFDIDKLFAYMKAFYSKGKHLIKYGEAKSAVERYDEYLRWEAKNNATLKLLIKEYEANRGLEEVVKERNELQRLLEVGAVDQLWDQFVEDATVAELSEQPMDEPIRRFLERIQVAIDYAVPKGTAGQGKREAKKAILDALMPRIQTLIQQERAIKSAAVRDARAKLGMYTLMDFHNDPKLVSKGALMNKIIDLHIKFATNPESTVAESLRTPATTKELEKDSNLISKLSGVDSEARYIGSSINGILDAWTNNIQGKRLVGIWANTNGINASLTKYKVRLNSAFAVNFDEGTYGTFAKEREDDAVFDGEDFKVVTDVRRKADSISGGVSAATDNAKERLMAKLRYTDYNTGVYGIMMSLGIGRTRTNLFAAQSALASLNASILGYETAIRKKPGSKEAALGDAIRGAATKIRQAYALNMITVTEVMLQGIAGKAITTQDMVKDLKGELTEIEKLEHDYRVLLTFKKLKDVQEHARKYGRLLSINKGISTQFDQVDGILESAEELNLGDLVGSVAMTPYNAARLPFDVRGILIPEGDKLTDSNTYHNLLNLYTMKFMSKKFFIKQTDWFSSTKDLLIRSTLVGFKDDDIENLDKALFNFAVMAGYSKYLAERPESPIDITRYAPLVYNNVEGLTLRDKFKLLLKKPEFANNELVKFIQTDIKGIQDRVMVNTRLQTTPASEQRFIDAYDALLKSPDPEIASYARDMFGYLLVRNGAMFANSSLVKFVKPEMFLSMAKVLRYLNRALYLNNNDLTRETTGYNTNELRGRFWKLFVADLNNYYKIRDLPFTEDEDGNHHLKPYLAGTSEGNEFPVYTITRIKKGITITTVPVRGEASLGNNKDIDYKLDENGKVIFNAPKAFKYTDPNGNRHVFMQTKHTSKTDNSGYETHSWSYTEIDTFGTPDYNPYTLPYEYSVQNFSFKAQKAHPEVAEQTGPTPTVSIDFQEEPTTGYRNRTVKNASADATIALAVDFNSAGEKLTKSSVQSQGKQYIPIDANNFAVTPERVKGIVDKLNSVNAKTLNIAGNGIYTMKGKYTQKQVDDFTYELLKAVLNHPDLKTKIESIRSGGQTGFDEAGAKAGSRLGLPTIVLAPKGWTFRDMSGKDISDEQQFKARFGKDVVHYTPEQAVAALPAQLQNIKTESGHVKIVKDVWTAQKDGEGIATLRGQSKHHFGNPFGTAKDSRYEIILVDTVPQAVAAYYEWLTTDKYPNVDPERKQWIRNQIASGKFAGKNLLYYKELGQASHANVLDYLINGVRQEITKTSTSNTLPSEENSLNYSVGTPQTVTNEQATNARAEAIIKEAEAKYLHPSRQDIQKFLDAGQYYYMGANGAQVMLKVEDVPRIMNEPESDNPTRVYTRRGRGSEVDLAEQFAEHVDDLRSDRIQGTLSDESFEFVDDEKYLGEVGISGYENVEGAYGLDIRKLVGDYLRERVRGTEERTAKLAKVLDELGILKKINSDPNQLGFDWSTETNESETPFDC